MEQAAAQLASSYLSNVNLNVLMKTDYEGKGPKEIYKEVYKEFYELVRSENLRIGQKQQQEANSQGDDGEADLYDDYK